jgi:hypothetical protein
MMVSTFAQHSPHLLGGFMLALACVPLIFIWQDRKRRAGDQRPMGKLRHEARIAAELRGRSAAKLDSLIKG